MVDQLPARQSNNALVSALATTTVAAAKSKENPYVKPGVDKCYRYEEPEHASINECLKMRQVNMTDY